MDDGCACLKDASLVLLFSYCLLDLSYHVRDVAKVEGELILVKATFQNEAMSAWLDRSLRQITGRFHGQASQERRFVFPKIIRYVLLPLFWAASLSSRVPAKHPLLARDSRGDCCSGIYPSSKWTVSDSTGRMAVWDRRFLSGMDWSPPVRASIEVRQ